MGAGAKICLTYHLRTVGSFKQGEAQYAMLLYGMHDVGNGQP